MEKESTTIIRLITEQKLNIKAAISAGVIFQEVKKMVLHLADLQRQLTKLKDSKPDPFI